MDTHLKFQFLYGKRFTSGVLQIPMTTLEDMQISTTQLGLLLARHLLIVFYMNLPVVAGQSTAIKGDTSHDFEHGIHIAIIVVATSCCGEATGRLVRVYGKLDGEEKHEENL